MPLGYLVTVRLLCEEAQRYIHLIQLWLNLLNVSTAGCTPKTSLGTQDILPLASSPFTNAYSFVSNCLHCIRGAVS